MSPGEYEQILHDAEVRLTRVKALYEQFFQGLEKLEPTVPRKELDRVLELLRKNQPRNTALRFRTQMLVARYGTYQTYWQRIARQIEEGTYRRDVVRVQQKRRREQAQQAKRPDEEREGPSAWEIDVDVDLEDAAALSFDDSDVDAILGSLQRAEEPAPSTPSTLPRRLSPFASSLPPAARRSTPSPPDATAPAPARPAIASFAKPVATFGKAGTASFAKPAITTASPSTTTPSTTTPSTTTPSTTAASSAPVPPPRPAPAAAAPPPRLVAPAADAPPARPAAAAVPPPRPRAPTSDPLDEARLRTIYDSYVDARRRNNERVDTVKYETVKQSVEQMMPKLREKHGDRAIDFEVVVQNGKVGLKPKVG